MATPFQCVTMINFRRILPIFKRDVHVSKVFCREKIGKDAVAAVDDDYDAQREAAIEAKRDVCRLPKNIEPLLESRARRREPIHAYQLSPHFLRKEYARLGSASGIDPSIMWPTVEELKKRAAWEAEWEPSLEERFRLLREKKQEEIDYIKRRTAEVAKNLENMPKVMKSHLEKQKKKSTLLEQQDLKRKRLLEEAREYFGYEIDPRDPKFQDMAVRKEEEAKLAAKKEKKAKRMAAKMASVTT